jgi:hypothetical protein
MLCHIAVSEVQYKLYNCAIYLTINPNHAYKRQYYTVFGLEKLNKIAKSLSTAESTAYGQTSFNLSKNLERYS